jgi:radical SAM superfamily enzyme YgiQ (UPF0313 family)
MKIVFIQPRTFHTWEALNIGYLASFLRLYRQDKIVFYSGFFDSDDEIISGCKDADVIGFSCTSPQMKHALSLARRIKSPQNYIVFGGVHPSALPQETLENEVIDAVVVGEGEEAFLEIINGNRKPLVNKPLIQNLDRLPFPDRRLVRQERNIEQAYKDNGIRIASVFSSRGCPYKCVFCASCTVWTRKCRFRSGTNILDEFQQVVDEFQIDFIKFSDDTFTVKKNVVIEFCREKTERGIRTPWGCNVHVATLDEEMLSLMFEAGCREVWMGVESGSPRILQDMKKGITIEKVEWAFKVTKRLGFFRRAYMLLGMPNESREDIKLTEDLIDRIKPDAVGFTILAPYPGTTFYDPVLHKDVDWAAVDEYENRLTKTNYLTNAELHREQNRLADKYKEVLVSRQRPLIQDEQNLVS